MPIPAPSMRLRAQLLPWSISVTPPPTSAPATPPYSASVAMMATAERPLGAVTTPTSSSVRTVVVGGGTALGSCGFTTTCVEGGAGCGCVVTVVVDEGGGGAGAGCCCVVVVVVDWATAGNAMQANASARV